MTDANKSPPRNPTAEAEQTSRSMQVIATVTGAFALPLMVYLSVGGGAPALREFVLLCMATTIGAAIGFAFFLPAGSFSGNGSLLRKVCGGTAVGLVMGLVTFSRLQMPPLAPATIFGLGLFATLGAFGAWGLSLRDDLSQRRRRGEAMAWPVKVFFGRGLLSLGAWVAVWAAGCIAYIVFDITQVASGRKPARTVAPSVALNPARQVKFPLRIAAQNNLPGQHGAEEIVTRLIDRRAKVLGDVEVNRATSDRRLDAFPAADDVSDDANLVVDETALAPAPEPISQPPAAETDIPSYDTATVAELLTVIEDPTSTQRHAAVSALDRFDPNDLETRVHRKQIAKTYLALAVDTESSLTQVAGVRGMVRWGGNYSVPHLIQLLESNPDVSLAEVIFAELSELNDPRGVAAIEEMSERSEYRDAARASLRAMDAAAEPAPSDAPANPTGD